MRQLNRPSISVLTPTWNRGAFLDRVWLGLSAQTYRNFEWIICDDGSSDETPQVLERLRERVTVPLTIIRASTHIGKPRMDNEGVRHSRGEFVLWNDSDDVLLPNALDRLMATWNSIPESDRENYVGITALCGDRRGVISTALPLPGEFDTTWNDLRLKSKIDGDMLHFVRGDLLKTLPFPEIDFVVPEQVVWSRLGHMKTRVCPEVLESKQYNAPNAISFTKKMAYCRGRAHAIAAIERNLSSYSRTNWQKRWALITFLRCCMHGEIGVAESRRLWGRNSTTSELLAMLPVATLLAAKDIAQGRVRRTHRDFETANRTVTMTVQAD